MIPLLPTLSRHAHTVDQITLTLTALTVFITLLVWFLIIFLTIKYRKGSAADRTHPRQKASGLELGLSALIWIFGLLTFIWSARVFYETYLPPAGATEIYVVGKQWMWTFHDPKTGDQINRLVVPAGVPVRLIMTSEDVIHSFFVPALRLKQDVLPDRYTSVWFNAEVTGEYEILCTQYCGLDHSQMRAVLEVVPKEDYLKRQRPSLSQAGLTAGPAAYAKFGCASCHDPAHHIGPDLATVYGRTVRLNNGRRVRADENYLRRSILQPNSEVVAGYPAVMPTFQGQVSAAELAALIEFIKKGLKP